MEYRCMSGSTLTWRGRYPRFSILVLESSVMVEAQFLLSLTWQNVASGTPIDMHLSQRLCLL